MPLDTQIARFLADTAGAAAPGSLAEMRAAAEAGLLQLQGEAEASGGVRDFTVTANDGHEIAIRAYLPLSAGETPLPAMLYAHGGGWCLGSLTLYDRPCQALANATGRFDPVGRLPAGAGASVPQAAGGFLSGTVRSG